MENRGEQVKPRNIKFVSRVTIFHCSAFSTPPANLMLPPMKIEIISVGAFEVNCCIVWGDAKQALVIDPGYDASLISACLDTHGLTVAAYLLTHGHADHINALAELHTARPAPVLLHAADLKWAFANTNQIPPYYPVPEKPGDEIQTPETQEIWAFGGLTFRVVETPGHTPGGICYWFETENVCFTGDTLFKGSCGRTDLPGGDGRVLAQSLKKLAALPPETRIIAGHGEETTIGHELKTNFFLK